MKNYFISILLLFICTTTLAQDSLQTGFVKYNTIVQADPYSNEYSTINSFLNFNKTESLYTKNKLGMDSIANLGKYSFDEKNIKMMSATHTEKGANYYRNFTTKEYKYNYPKLSSIPAYIVNDDWLEMNWNIINDFKEIAGYKTQKATTTFRGTDFEVWFTPDVPLPYGPLNLFGLPGVIFEVKYNNQTQLTAYEVCYPCETIFEIEAPTEPIVKTVKEHVHLRDNWEYYLVVESNKQLNVLKMKLGEMPTEKKIQEKRQFGFEKLYEWENEKTKRLVPKKDLEKVVSPKKKEEKPKPATDLYFRPEPMNTQRF